MNFLDLCKRTREEVGYSGTGPSSVIGQLGEMGRLVNKVNSAWLEIQQSRNNWRFMLTELSTSTVASTNLISVSTLKTVDPDSFRIIDDDVNYPLQHITADQARYFPELESRPTHFWTDRGKVYLYPTPDKVYTLKGDYYKVPTLMTLANTSIPSLPEEYHEAIIWLAVKNLGAFEESSNTYSHAMTEYRKIFDRMLESETPGIYFGGPLA